MMFMYINKFLNNYFHKVGSIARTLTYLAIFFYISQLIWPYIELHFTNPLDIHGTSPSLQFNPLNNSLRYLMMLGIVLGGYFLTEILPDKIVKPGMRIIFIGTLIWGYFLIALVHLDNGRYFMDMFHDGEQLGNAALYLQGRGVYDGIMSFHGAFTDPLIAIYAFKIFGQSVGSFLMFTAVLRLVSFTIFFVLLFTIIENDAIFYIASIWFYNMVSGSADFQAVNFAVSTIRDIPVWMILLFLWFYLRKGMQNRVLLFGIGALSGFEYFISLDRAFYLTILVFFLAIFMTIIKKLTKENRQMQYSLSIQKKTIVMSLFNVFFLLLGFLTGFLTQIPLIGVESFIAFLKFMLTIFPKTVSMLAELPFPSYPQAPASWFPIFGILFAGVYIIYCYLIPVFRNLHVRLSFRNIYVVIVFILSVIFFKSTIIRSDMYHFVYGTVLIFLTIFSILDVEMSSHKVMKLTSGVFGSTILSVFVLMILFNFNLPKKSFGPPFIPFNKLYLLRRPECFIDTQEKRDTAYDSPLHYYFLNHFYCPPYREVSDIKAFFALPTISDTYWLELLPVETNVVGYINEHTTKNDYVFVFNNEAVYYYYLNGKSPTKFSQVWLADNKSYRKDLLQDLQNNPPKYIIYSTGSMGDALENVPMTERFPSINKWLLENYPKRTTIQRAVILSKE